MKTIKGVSIVECKNCSWFKINPFIFDDGTQTMECIKYNSFLGFTTSTGEITKQRKNDNCIYKEVIDKPIKKRQIAPKSNVRGITWDKRDKIWKVTFWDRKTRRKIYLGQHKDLDQAIKLLEEWLKMR